MSKPELIKRSGWAFITGALAFATILSTSDAIQIPGLIISALLLAAGMLSLRGGYSETIGHSGRNILLMGVVGAILWDVVVVSSIVMYISGIFHPSDAQGHRFWIVTFGGPAVALLGLTLFGLTNLRRKRMSRLNWLSILAAIWYPVIYCFLFVYLVSHNGKLPDPYWSPVKSVFTIQVFALFVFGLVLVADTPQEIATT